MISGRYVARRLAGLLAVVALVAACAAPSGRTTCTQGALPCGNGTYESCLETDADTTCLRGFYRSSDGLVFPWASCTDYKAAAEATNKHCAFVDARSSSARKRPSAA